MFSRAWAEIKKKKNSPEVMHISYIFIWIRGCYMSGWGDLNWDWGSPWEVREMRVWCNVLLQLQKNKKRIIITILTCFLHASIASMRHSDGGKVSLVSSSFLFINLGRFFNSPGQVGPTWNHAILTDWNKYEDTRQSTISVQNVAISI